MNQPSPRKDRWFVRPRPKPSADLRLFLFPYAGGAPTAFSKWPSEFPDNIDTNIIHYPGRGSRFNESPIKELSVLVQGINHAILPLLDKPFIFFGHSMGGMIAFELARQLRQQNLPQPQTLFISACGAPQLPDPNHPLHPLPDSEFIKSLQKLNGLPADVINNSELTQLLLPTLRADFEAVENHKYNFSEDQLECPIIAFGGSDDTHVTPERLEGWSAQTSASFKSQYFAGDHFFINTVRQSVTTSIIDWMTKSHETR